MKMNLEFFLLPDVLAFECWAFSFLLRKCNRVEKTKNLVERKPSKRSRNIVSPTVKQLLRAARQYCVPKSSLHCLDVHKR